MTAESHATSGSRGERVTREHRIVATFVELADTMVDDFDVIEFLALRASM